jgi:hypothetical protein
MGQSAVHAVLPKRLMEVFLICLIRKEKGHAEEGEKVEKRRLYCYQ